MTKRRAESRSSTEELLLAALDLGMGALLVTDAGLKIVAFTPQARALLGEDIPVGALVTKFLCGSAKERPIAAALAEGKPVRGTIVQAREEGSAILVVRATPIESESGARGHVVALELAAVAEEEETFFAGMWTRDPRMLSMFRVLERAARRDVSVLVRGETGAGKELVARAIHDLSPRAKGPFSAVNCAALPPNLLESELFGHVRGAFTGAVRDQPGYFQTAHGGTLFLDEIAEMPLDLQAKLLRVLETKTVIPVGGREPINVDVRIVAATHRSLRRAVAEGRFRADLMYRLRVVPLFLPPLRARPADIALLLEKFIARMNAQGGRVVDRFSPGAWSALARHPFPGNVRELKNILEYAYVVGDGPVLAEGDLPPELVDPSFYGDEAGAQPSLPAAAPDEHPEASRIRAALSRSGGSRERAAKMLGLSRVTLWRRMKEHGIEA